MKVVKIKSDYDPDTVLTLIQTDYGDIIVDISGNEVVISASGSQFTGSGIIKRFSEIIDVLGKEMRPDK